MLCAPILPWTGATRATAVRRTRQAVVYATIAEALAATVEHHVRSTVGGALGRAVRVARAGSDVVVRVHVDIEAVPAVTLDLAHGTGCAGREADEPDPDDEVTVARGDERIDVGDDVESGLGIECHRVDVQLGLSFLGFLDFAQDVFHLTLSFTTRFQI